MPQEPALGTLGDDGEGTLGGLFSRLKSTEMVAELIQKQMRKNEWESEMRQHGSLSSCDSGNGISASSNTTTRKYLLVTGGLTIQDYSRPRLLR